MRADELAARLLSMFVEELEEQLRLMNDDLLALERAPADAERLRSLFRVVHSLKGAARAAGVPAVEELCHALEGELAPARDGRQPLTPTQLVHGFAAADSLTDAARRLRSGEAVPAGAYDALLVAIRNGTPVPNVPARPAAPPPPAEVAALPAAAAAAPGAAEAQRDAGTDGAGEQVRVAVRRLDALIAAAVELRESTAAAADWRERLLELRGQLGRWRALWRRDRAAASAAVDGWLTHLTAGLAALDEGAAQFRGAEGAGRRLLEGARRLRQRPFGDATASLARVARDVALRLGKEVELVVSGEDVEADRPVLEALRDPLVHLVRNAIDHGIEMPDARARAGKPRRGTLRVAGALRGDRLTVTVGDDGAGLDIPAIRAALARAGRLVPADDQAVARALLSGQLSTRAETTEISGRGVGLDAARAAVERLGGTLDVRWIPGQGTTFTIDAPLSVATMRALLVEVGGHPVALPTALVERVARVGEDATAVVAGERVLRTADGVPARLASLGRLLGGGASGAGVAGVAADAEGARRTTPVVVVATGGARLALAVDELREERELVVRPIEHAPGTAERYVGAALLPGGAVAPVLNVPGLIGAAGDLAVNRNLAAPAAERRPRILVADDSITTRALEESVLAAAGYDVVTAPDGAEALRLVEAGGVDLLVTDVEMPRMTGLELTARVRASRAHASLPVIIVSSLDRPEHRAQGLEAGADAYVTKSSFEQGELLALVRRLLGTGHGGDVS